jgi:hypothetical protein
MGSTTVFPTLRGRIGHQTSGAPGWLHPVPAGATRLRSLSVPRAVAKDPSTRTLLLVDAGAVAGWRRATPSLGQLHQALLHLRAQHPALEVAVVGDPALKHQLAPIAQPDFDADVSLGIIVCAPAGTVGGTEGFFATIAERAERNGATVLTVTDRALPFGRLVRLQRDGGRWGFDLVDTAAPTAGAIAAPAKARRRRRPATPPRDA